MVKQRSFQFLLPLVAACCLAVFLAPTAAEARNVPGSAAAAGSELSEIASTGLADGILEALQGGSGPAFGGVSQDASGNVTLSTIGSSFETENGFVGGAHFGYRDLDIDGEIDGALITGGISFGQRLDSGLLVFSSLLLEQVDVDTAYNSGTLDGSGYGLALGIQTPDTGGLQYSAMVGAMALNYDLTRAAGTVTGSYDASRWFLDLRASNEVMTGFGETQYSFGLRHVQQSDEAYVEAGGGAVAAIDYSSTTAFLNTRSYLGQYSGGARPYLQGDIRYLIGDNSAIPGVGPDSGDGLRGYTGIGIQSSAGGMTYDAGLGSNYNDDGYSGFTARLSIALQF